MKKLEEKIRKEIEEETIQKLKKKLPFYRIFSNKRIYSDIRTLMGKYELYIATEMTNALTSQGTLFTKPASLRCTLDTYLSDEFSDILKKINDAAKERLIKCASHLIYWTDKKVMPNLLDLLRTIKESTALESIVEGISNSYDLSEDRTNKTIELAKEYSFKPEFAGALSGFLGSKKINEDVKTKYEFKIKYDVFISEEFKELAALNNEKTIIDLAKITSSLSEDITHTERLDKFLQFIYKNKDKKKALEKISDSMSLFGYFFEKKNKDNLVELMHRNISNPDKAADIISNLSRMVFDTSYMASDNNSLVDNIFKVYNCLDASLEAHVYIEFSDYFYGNKHNPGKINDFTGLVLKEQDFLNSQGSEVIFPMAIVLFKADEKFHDYLKGLGDYTKLNLARAYSISKANKKPGSNDDYTTEFYNGFRQMLETRPDKLGQWAKTIVDGFKKKSDKDLSRCYDAA